jgi:hypothetical protein
MTTCKHDWKFCPEFSNVHVIRRFKCQHCGCFGYQSPPTKWDGFQQKPIRSYAGPKSEPEPQWLQPEYRERVTWPTMDPDYMARHTQSREVGLNPDETWVERSILEANCFKDPGEL